MTPSRSSPGRDDDRAHGEPVVPALAGCAVLSWDRLVGHHVQVEFAGDDLAGDVGQAQVPAARVAAQPVERRVHGQTTAWARTPLACSMTTRLCRAVCSCSVRTSPRRIARSCRMPIVATSASACPSARSASGSDPGGVEQVQRPDRFTAQPQRQRVHGAEGPRVRERRDEAGHRSRGLGQVGNADRGGGAETVQARALVGLQLQQLHQLGLLAGGGDRPQLAAGVAEHDPGRVGGQQLDAVAHQPVEQVDDVVVVDQVSASATNAGLIAAPDCADGSLLAHSSSRSTASRLSMSSVNTAGGQRRHGRRR